MLLIHIILGLARANQSTFSTPTTLGSPATLRSLATPKTPSKRATPSTNQGKSKSRRITSEHHDGTPASPGQQSPNPVRRSEKAKAACKKRDNEKCVLTGWLQPDVAHISPFSLHNSNTVHFWALLQVMWGKEKAEVWRDAVALDADGNEKVSNLLCLTPTLHRWWKNAKFALKPISVSGNELRVQFFWLKDVKHHPNQLIDLLTKPEDVLTEQPCQQGRKLFESGTFFTIKAEDPDELPSWEILEMQWNLQRLAAMSGAADVDLENFDDDNDPEIPVLTRHILQQKRGDYEWSEPEISSESEAEMVF